MAGAQEVIFRRARRQIGNLAEAYGDTLPGQIDKTDRAIIEHKKIGAALARPYESALSAIDKFLQERGAIRLWSRQRTEARLRISSGSATRLSGVGPR